MINLFLAAVLSSVVIDVTLSNGQQLSGELASLDADTVSIQIETGEGGLRRIARAGIKNIDFEKSVSEIDSPKVVVELIDESSIPCETIVLAEGKAKLGQGPIAVEAGSKSLRLIRWPQPNDSDEQWNEILAKAGADDLLVVRRQSLDYLKGVVLGITKDTIQFEYSGNTIPVPMSKVAGVIFASVEGEVPAARLRLMTQDGGLWALQDAKLNGDTMFVTTLSGVETKLPLSDVLSIDYPQLGAVFLSDLEPSSVSVKPFFGSATLSKAIESLSAPRFDVAFDGGPIRLSSEASVDGWQEFKRGVAIQSRSEIVYRLAGQYQRFKAMTGIAYGSPSQADVELKVYADEREIYAKPIRGGEEPMPIDVDVSRARRLRLVVDYGKHANIGDRLHLGDARLLK